MGFDLSGVNAKNKIGEYFRNNVWWWRRLWHFVYEIAWLPEGMYYAGSYNDGYRVPNQSRVIMISAIKEALANKESKRVKQILAMGEAEFGKDYHFDWDNVQNFVNFLENNEGFEIW